MSEYKLQTFRHDQAASLGVLMVNLGTPDAPDRASVRRYLKEFLWDARVVEMARPIWWFVLNVIILNTRPGRSAKAYQKVWTAEGSPLLVISQKQRAALAELLELRFGCKVPVALGMRYGKPSIAAALQELREAGARRILVLPLYHSGRQRKTPPVRIRRCRKAVDVVPRHPRGIFPQGRPLLL